MYLIYEVLYRINVLLLLERWIEFLFFFDIYDFFNFILFLNFTNCISFVKYQNESAIEFL